MKCHYEVLLFSSACSVFRASALPTLIERQDSLWHGDDPSNFLNTAGAVVTGIGGTLLNFINSPSGLLDKATSSASLGGEDNDPKNQGQGPMGGPTSTTAVKECNAVDDQSCDQPLRMVIFPLSSCDTERNKAVTSKLKEMVGKNNLLTSKAFNCPGTKPGVMLWVAKKMTKAQMQTILKNGDVASILPDGPLKADAGNTDDLKVAMVDPTQANPDQGNQDQGNQDQGNQDQGNQYQGNLDQGNLDQGSLGQNSEDQQQPIEGSQNQGSLRQSNLDGSVASADINLGSVDQGNLQFNPENPAEGISAQNDPGQGTFDQWKTEQDNAKLSRKKRSSIKKRASVVVQHPAETELAFVSTPPQTAPSDYAYFDNAGKGVTIYLIADGLQPLNNELAGRVKDKWIYTLGVPQTQLDPQGSGTCVGSIIVGKEHGVAKEAKLAVVKIDSRNWSTYFDAFGTIIGKLRKKVKEGEKVAGYTIVATSMGWHSNDLVDLPSGARFKFQELIHTLVNELQVVLVAAAGDDYEKDNSQVNTYPAAYSSEQVPMITVGALDPSSGQKTTWTQDGAAVTIYAPGIGSCAGNGVGDPTPIASVGTNLAMAHTAGLAAYFLSLADVGNMIKSKTNIPRALRDYIVRRGYNRVAGVLGIWNGLSPNPGPDDKYGWVP